MIRPTRRLQTRVMLVFAGFTLLVAAVFGLYAMVFTYAVEDEFFDAMLRHEAATQLREFREHGRWSVPHDPAMRLYAQERDFPDDLRRARVDEPWRREFAGEQRRHYHLLEVTPPAPARPVWLVAEVSRQLVVRPMREQILLLLAGTGVALVLLALALGYWLARRTTGPLSRLAGRVDAMTPDRPLPPIADTFADDEVGVLARGLDALNARVQSFIAREQEFTRDASHELRTPLAVIRSACERLLAEPALSSAARGHLLHMQQSAAQLEQTVTMLLSLSRETAPATGEPIALLPLLERVIVEQAPLLGGKPVQVRLDVPRDARFTLPGPVLHVLVSNLVGNAFAHTQAGEVGIDMADGRLRIANTGDVAADWPGEGGHGKREGSSGFGLGLAIVRRLCRHFDVDLRIERGEHRTTASLAPAAPDAVTAGGTPLR
jgi:signal transduction histidine kinase